MNPQTRLFESFDELDRYVDSLNGRPESEVMPILSNCFLVDPHLVTMPDDPFSPEYRDAVRELHARVSGFEDYDESLESWSVDIDAAVRRPAAYRNDGAWLAGYLESFAHVIRQLDVQRGMRVVDLGCGEAEILLHLGRLGCEVVAVDLHQDQLEVVRRKAERLGIPIQIASTTFEGAWELGTFDRVLFYQAFHHSAEHQDLVAGFDSLLNPWGRIVFGAEPVVEPGGAWKHAVPYPWGPRLDGISLRQMRKEGWMELGFQTTYFHDLLARHGWTYSFVESDDNALVSSVVSERIAEQGQERPPFEPHEPAPGRTDGGRLGGVVDRLRRRR